MIFALASLRLREDWQRLYAYRPLLLKTLVDSACFGGTCYRAGNWIHLGATQGRDRMDRDHPAHGHAVKNIYVFPLCRNAREKLRAAEPPVYVEELIE